jgi:hypothetical protein
MPGADEDGGVRLDFTLQVHQLRPWPLSSRSSNNSTAAPQLLAIGWQRGKRKGHVAAVKPKVTSKAYAVYQFNDTLTIGARLKRVRSRRERRLTRALAYRMQLPALPCAVAHPGRPPGSGRPCPPRDRSYRLYTLMMVSWARCEAVLVRAQGSCPRARWP